MAILKWQTGNCMYAGIVVEYADMALPFLHLCHFLHNFRPLRAQLNRLSSTTPEVIIGCVRHRQHPPKYGVVLSPIRYWPRRFWVRARKVATFASFFFLILMNKFTNHTITMVIEGVGSRFLLQIWRS